MRIKTCDEVLNKLLEIGDSVDNPADIDVYWKFTDKGNLEYARKRGVSEYITFAGLGRVNNKRWPTGAREGSKNAERGAYTPKSLASLCKFLEREFKDCGDCLFVSGDGRALNDIVVENGKVVLIFGRATGCFTRESVENEETKMKKLNITKEAFEKSRYFNNKYGTLEYVSESGKLFKTNKGKVLMFKESIVNDEQKWNDDLWDCIITDVQSLGDEISSALMDADGNPTYDFEAAVKVARNAVSQEIADEVGEDITFTHELSQFVTPMEYATRIVDYVIEKQPTKSIARRLKKIGY